MAAALSGISSSPPLKRESLPRIRRSRSEPILRCSVSTPRASATLKSARSVPPFLVDLSRPVRSILFETDEEAMAFDSNEVGSREEGRKGEKANWMKQLLELRRRWRGGGEESTGMDSYCSVNYDSNGDMEEELADEIVWDRDSFARLLMRVPWTEAKLFSQLAYLCNMAYVIPEIKVCFYRFSVT